MQLNSKIFLIHSRSLRALRISQSCSYLSWQCLFSVSLATPDPWQSAALESLLVSKIKGTRGSSKIPTGFITTPHYMAVLTMLRQNWCRKNSSTFPGRFLPDDSTGWGDGFKVTSAQGDKKMQAVLHVLLQTILELFTAENAYWFLSIKFKGNVHKVAEEKRKQPWKDCRQMQRAPLGSGTNKCGCIVFSSHSQFMKFHVMLKGRLLSSAEPASDPPTELKLNPACKNSIRHKRARAKDIHGVPPLPPQRETSDIPGRDRNSHTPGETLEIPGGFQAFPHPPPEARRCFSKGIVITSGR